MQVRGPFSAIVQVAETGPNGFRHLLPLGPAVETERDPLEKVAVICRVNGEVRQAGFTRIWSSELPRSSSS